MTGVPVVPIPPDSGSAELRHILTDAKVTCWAGPAYPESDLPVIPALERGRVGGELGGAPSADAVAMILYTSGTTGAPKGVNLSHRALAACIDAVADAWQWTRDDTVVHGLPLFHLHGLVLGVLGSLRIGSRVVHTVKPRPERYAEAAGTLYFGVPTVWSRIAADEESARALRRARLLVSGSAPLPTPVFHRIAELTGRPRRTLRHERNLDHSQHARRRRTPPRVGRPARAGSPRPVADRGRAGGAA